MYYNNKEVQYIYFHFQLVQKQALYVNNLKQAKKNFFERLKLKNGKSQKAEIW